MTNDTKQQKNLPGAVLLDVHGSGAFLGLTDWEVRGLITRQELPVVRVGRKFFLRRSTLIRWTERAEETAPR